MTADLVTALANRSEVHLWLRWLALDVEPSAAEVSVLGADERERADRFLRDVDRRRFIRRHLHLREVLARYLKIAADRVPLEAKLHRPPRLTGEEHMADHHFSLSSSADRSAVAVAWRRPVGVDIERIDGAVDIDGVAGTVFSQEECRALNRASASARRAVFFKIWARKEAFVKAKGTGLARDLMSFDVLDADAGTMLAGEALVVDRESASDGRPWLVRDVAGPENFALAVSAEGDDWSFVRHGDGA